MLNYRALQLSAGNNNFIDEAFDLLRNFEVHINFVYDDRVNNANPLLSHNPTIGDGINLSPAANGQVLDNHLALVLDELGVFDADDARELLERQQNDLLPETLEERNARYNDIVADFRQVINDYPLSAPSGSTYGTHSSEIALQTALDSLLRSYLDDPSAQFHLDQDQSEQVVKWILEGHQIGEDLNGEEEGGYYAIDGSDVGKVDRLDARLLAEPYGIDMSGAHSTYEYMALLSLFYNGEGLIGPGLRSAIRDGNRAEAWYEIRYNSNTSDLRGIAKRRYYESQLFGLREDPNAAMSEAEALQIYRMYTAHRPVILDYENEYGSGQADATNQIIRANNDYQIIEGYEVQTLEQSFESAYTYLRNNYIVTDDINSPITIDYRDIQVGDNSGNIIGETERNDFILLDGLTQQNDLILGLGGNDTLSGGGGQDILYGGDNIDEIYGGVGDDYLFGELGNDILDGEGGSDALHGGAGRDGYRVSGVQTEIDTLIDSGNDNDNYAISGSGYVDITDAGGDDKYVFDNFLGTTRIGDNGDQRGSISIFGQNIAATMIPVQGLENTWDSPGTDPDKRLQFELQGNELTITTVDLGRIIIENFTNGDFGIRLLNGPVADNTGTEVTSDNNGINQLTAVVQIPESRLEMGSPDVFASFKIVSDPQGEPRLSISYLTFLIDGEVTRAEIHEELQQPLIQELVDIMSENTSDPELQAQLADFVDESIGNVDYRAKVVIEPREVVDENGATTTQNLPIIYFSEVTDGADESQPFTVDPTESIAANPDGAFEQVSGDLVIVKRGAQVADIDFSDASPFASLNFGVEFDLSDVGRYFSSRIGLMSGEVDQIAASIDSAFFSAVGDKLNDTLSLSLDEGAMHESVISAFEDIYNSIGIINDALMGDLIDGLPNISFEGIGDKLSDLFDGLLSFGNGNEFDVSFDSLNQKITDFASEFYNSTLPEEIADSIMSELTAEFDWNETETADVRSKVRDYVDVLLDTQRGRDINLSALNTDSRALLLDLMDDDLAGLLVGDQTVLDLATDYYTNEFPDNLANRIVDELDLNENIEPEIRPLIENYTQALVDYSVGNNVDFARLNQEAKAVSIGILRDQVGNYVTETIISELDIEGNAVDTVESIVGSYASELTSVFTDGEVDFSDANANLRAQVPALSALLTAELINSAGLDGALADLVEDLGTRYITEVLSYLTGSDNELDFAEINSDLVDQFGEQLANTAKQAAADYILDRLGVDETTEQGQLVAGIVNDYVGEAIDYLAGNSVEFSELNATLDNRIGDFISGAIARGLAEETGLSIEQANALVDIGKRYLGFGESGDGTGLIGGPSNNDLANSSQLAVGTELNGALASIITAELVSALGIEEGPLSDFATAAGTAVVGQIIGNVATGSPLFEGIGDIDFTELGLNVVSAYIGGEIGEEIYEVETTEGAIGAALGSTIGASYGAEIGADIGSVWGAHRHNHWCGSGLRSWRIAWRRLGRRHTEIGCGRGL